MLFKPIDAALGTTARVRVLREFARAGRPLTGREVERLAGVGHASARDALRVLTDLGLLRNAGAGRQHAYSLQTNSLLGTAISGLFAAEQERVTVVFGWLRAFAAVPDSVLPAAVPPPSPVTPQPIITMVLFGSATRGTDRPDSDTDVLLVVPSARAVDETHAAFSEATLSAEQFLGLRLSCVVIDMSAIRERAADGDQFLTEVARDERVVIGSSIAAVIRESASSTLAQHARATR